MAFTEHTLLLMSNINSVLSMLQNILESQISLSFPFNSSLLAEECFTALYIRIFHIQQLKGYILFLETYCFYY